MQAITSLAVGAIRAMKDAVQGRVTPPLVTVSVGLDGGESGATLVCPAWQLCVMTVTGVVSFCLSFFFFPLFLSVCLSVGRSVGLSVCQTI